MVRLVRRTVAAALIAGSAVLSWPALADITIEHGNGFPAGGFTNVLSNNFPDQSGNTVFGNIGNTLPEVLKVQWTSTDTLNTGGVGQAFVEGEITNFVFSPASADFVGFDAVQMNLILFNETGDPESGDVSIVACSQLGCEAAQVFTITSNGNDRFQFTTADPQYITSISVQVITDGDFLVKAEQFRVIAVVPGPIVGAGIPGLILACGAMLGLARRRRHQLV